MGLTVFVTVVLIVLAVASAAAGVYLLFAGYDAD
jgi:hypothetical protein